MADRLADGLAADHDVRSDAVGVLAVGRAADVPVVRLAAEARVDLDRGVARLLPDRLQLVHQPPHVLLHRGLVEVYHRLSRRPSLEWNSEKPKWGIEPSESSSAFSFCCVSRCVLSVTKFGKVRSVA